MEDKINQSCCFRHLFNDKDLWVFGYGSLIWKTEFPREFQVKKLGMIKGYKRRFWQPSIDHRGVPGKPGRVVTIVQDKNSVVWGVAYQFHKEDAEAVLNYLDSREKNGYECRMLNFYPKDSNESFEVFLIFIRKNRWSSKLIRGSYLYWRELHQIVLGTPTNFGYCLPHCNIKRFFLKTIRIDLDQQTGLSGSNSEYLFNLTHALRSMNLDLKNQERHLFRLENEVKKIMEKYSKEKEIQIIPKL